MFIYEMSITVIESQKPKMICDPSESEQAKQLHLPVGRQV